MTFASDDLASVLIAPQREHAGYGQGILVSFDTETFENIVDYRGTRLTNLPVLSGPDALTYQAGDVVLLMRWSPTGNGLASYWIAGRPVIPGAGRGEAAVSFMSGALARAISAEVFADRIFTDEVAPQVQISNQTTFGDLPGSAGPTVTATIGDSGVAVVAFGCRIEASTNATPSTATGYMSIEVSGSTSVSPSVEDSFRWQMGDVGLSGTRVDGVRASSVRPITGLNPGEHTFTAKYRTGTSDATVGFDSRALTVIAL